MKTTKPELEVPDECDCVQDGAASIFCEVHGPRCELHGPHPGTVDCVDCLYPVDKLEVQS